MAAVLTLEIDQGATFRRIFELKDADGRAIDLTGATARLQIRRTIRSSTVTLEAKADNGKLALGGELGTIELVLEPADTALLDASGVYDLELTYANGDVRRELRGAVRVNPSVTR